MSLEDITTWSCPECGFKAQKPAGEFAAVFHPCRPVKQRPRTLWSVPDTEQERQDWARRLLGDPLADAVVARDGEEALLRDLGDEEP